MENLVIVNVEKGFWENKKVFITGHTGFKGSWLCLYLQALKANIGGYSLGLVPELSLWREISLEGFISHYTGHICDTPRLREAITDFSPEIVIHMAAQPLVRLSYQQPYETFNVNVMGTASVLEACRDVHGLRSIVVVTSDKCYLNKNEKKAFREDDPLGGFDPYSASKACTEIVAHSYRKSFYDREKGSILGLATARAGNVIGGGDFSKDRIVPDMVAAFCAGETVAIRFPHATRPWQHVLEPLDGYLTLARKLYYGGDLYCGGWNFTNNETVSHTVKDIVSDFSDLWGDGARYNIDASVKVPEIDYLAIDNTKTTNVLSWKPVLDYRTTIEWTVKWYKDWSMGKKADILCRQQIDDYIKRRENMS